MADTLHPKSNSSPGGSLPARLEHLERELAAKSRQANRSSTATALVGAVVVVLLAGYFAYGYSQIQEVTRPARLVDTAQSMIDDNLPNARKSVEEEVTKSAPVWAEHLSKQAVDAFPSAREKFRDLIIERIDASIDEAKIFSQDQFQAFLDKNGEALNKKFEELANKPELADASLAELEAMLETQFKTDMQFQSKELLNALISCNARLKKLSEGKGLDSKDQLWVTTLQLLRRLQEENSETATGAPSPPPSSLAVPGRAMHPDRKKADPAPEDKPAPKDNPPAAKAEEKPAK
jgi:hypothetical protein